MRSVEIIVVVTVNKLESKPNLFLPSYEMYIKCYWTKTHFEIIYESRAKAHNIPIVYGLILLSHTLTWATLLAKVFSRLNIIFSWHNLLMLEYLEVYKEKHKGSFSKFDVLFKKIKWRKFSKYISLIIKKNKQCLEN